MTAPTRPGCILLADVSEAQHAVDWRFLRAQGVRGVIVRASEGEWHPDPFWTLHATSAAEDGALPVGSYHAFHPRHADPTDQARRYMDRAYDRTALAPALDVELAEGQPLDVVAERALDALAWLADAWGKTPWLYTGADFGAQLAAEIGRAHV